MNRWFALIPLAILVALTVLFVGWSLKRDPAFKPDAIVGKPIPETVLPILTGGRRPADDRQRLRQLVRAVPGRASATDAAQGPGRGRGRRRL